MTVKNDYPRPQRLGLTGRLHLPSDRRYREGLGTLCSKIETEEEQLKCAFHFVLQGLNRTDGKALLDRSAYYEIQRPRHPLHKAFRSYLAAYPVCGNQ